MKESFKPSSTGQLRLARYKPNGNPGSQVLYAEHTDYNSFTFLWRNRTNGLQAKLNGSWTPIPLLPDHPDALLVNLGDLMEVWTGGVWKSPRHQVLDLKTYFGIFLSQTKSLFYQVLRSDQGQGELLSIVWFSGFFLEKKMILPDCFLGPNLETPLLHLPSPMLPMSR